MPCQSHFRELCNLFHALREAISRFEVAYLLHPDSCYCRPGGEACWQHRGHYKQGSEDLQEAEKTDQTHTLDQGRQEEPQEVWTDSHSVKIDQEKLEKLAKAWVLEETKPEPAKREELREEQWDTEEIDRQLQRMSTHRL